MVAHRFLAGCRVGTIVMAMKTTIGKLKEIINEELGQSSDSDDPIEVSNVSVRKRFPRAYKDLVAFLGPEADERGEDPITVKDSGGAFELHPLSRVADTLGDMEDETGWEVEPGKVLCYFDDAYALGWRGPKRAEFEGGWSSID